MRYKLIAYASSDAELETKVKKYNEEEIYIYKLNAENCDFPRIKYYIFSYVSNPK